MRRLVRNSLPVALLVSSLTLGGGSAGAQEPTPGDVTEQLGVQQVQVAPAGAAPPQSGDEVPTQPVVEEYLADRLREADEVWTAFFARLGLPEPKVSYLIVTPESGPYKSNCSSLPVIHHNTPNAYYCGGDEASAGFPGTIYLPVTTMQHMWTGDIFGRQSVRKGDFAAAILTAHEFGHHVVHELSEQSRQPLPTGKWWELISDCMAGVWATSAYYRGTMQPGNFEEAVAALVAIGDTAITAEPHGTSEERKNALLTGYNGIPNRYPPGAPAACTETYWKYA